MIIKKILKYLAILVGVFMLFWGVVVGIIATPEIITPQIVTLAQKYVKSEVSIKSVDLSLFTRFPNITLRIDSLRIRQTNDTVSDLLFAQRCHISVNPMALLSKNVTINRVMLHNASMYVYVDSLHGPVKTFILPENSEDEDTAADSTSSIDISEYTLTLRRLRIDSTQLVIDDRTREFYTRVENFGIDMSMNLSSTISEMEVVTGFSNLIVWHKGDLLVKKTSMDLRSDMQFDLDSMKLSFDRARVMVNDIDLRTSGSLRQDSTAGGVIVDMRSSLSTPSLSEFLALIPPTIIDNKEAITTEGAVVFDVDVQGLYSEESMPNIGATLKIEDAKAKYASRRLSLEEVNCDAYMFVDLNTPKNSYADVKSLQINTSEIIDLTFSGRVDNILDDPVVDMTVKSDIDLDRFSEVFPLNEGIVCSGTNQSDIKMQFTLADVQNSNYADLYINGESVFRGLEVSFDASKFAQDSSSVAYLYVQAERGHLLFGDNVLAETDSRTLRSRINLQGLGYKSKTGEYVTIKDIELTLGANFDRASSVMNGMGIRGIAQNTDMGVDSLFSASLESSDLTFIVTPKSEEREATIRASISSQQISANEPNYNSDMNLSSVDMELSMQRIEPRLWDMTGTVAFSDLGLFTDLFPLEVKIPQTSVSVSNKTINLNNAELSLGGSEIVATGQIHNLMRKLFVNPREALSGELRITASHLNFSELLVATNQSVLMMDELEADTLSVSSVLDEQVELVAAVADSTARADAGSIFLVPGRMDFVFDLNITEALFEDATIENVEGRATLKDGVLSLDRLNLRAIGAEATGSIVYRNIGRSSANLAADISLVGVDINRIGELMPSIESMLPMLESFEGMVDFDLKANTNLDSNSEPDYSTLYSAMRFKGKNLVLMDSETFADISKTLMFKNKDRNLIDSLEAYALVDGTKIDLLPFSMTMDRYSAIIGGSQVIDPETFDVDYEYNISIMKSPLPFKAGIDVTGNLEDFKYKITSAKLKKTDFDQQRGIYDEYRGNIDELANTLQQEIEARRLAMQERRRAQRLAQQQAEQQTDAEEQALAAEQEAENSEGSGQATAEPEPEPEQTESNSLVSALDNILNI